MLVDALDELWCERRSCRARRIAPDERSRRDGVVLRGRLACYGPSSECWAAVRRASPLQRRKCFDRGVRVSEQASSHPFRARGGRCHQASTHVVRSCDRAVRAHEVRARRRRPSEWHGDQIVDLSSVQTAFGAWVRAFDTREGRRTNGRSSCSRTLHGYVPFPSRGAMSCSWGTSRRVVLTRNHTSRRSEPRRCDLRPDRARWLQRYATGNPAEHGGREGERLQTIRAPRNAGSTGYAAALAAKAAWRRLAAVAIATRSACVFSRRGSRS